ncbi:glycerate kinase [Paraburkholderia bannensis]|uniref:glycerate kinase n=1 Tax=Paraburkholderia bannensis TaxID=765414 RepID=UPI002ABD82E0|nr:glycerate kinase [Paraburkholderia bannensis]
MKIVIAPDSFKESLTAAEAARSIETGFAAVFPDANFVSLPIADGGEGTVNALKEPMGAQMLSATVTDPLGRPVAAEFGLTKSHVAILEMASASGLHLVLPADRNPLVATTRGLGELVLAALDAGARHFIVGIGGSATNDCGVGFLQALGVKFLDSEGCDLPAGAADLQRLVRIDRSGIDARLASCTFDVACDVDNPLCGPAGASAIFGPQKGATPRMIQRLDEALRHVAEVIRRDFDISVESLPGSGAAGGMGAAMVAFLNAKLKPGSAIVADALNIEQAIEGADLVITGEGCVDGQTSRGKAPAGIAQIATRLGVPVIALGGAVLADAGELSKVGIHAAFPSVRRACSLDAALREAAVNLQMTARNVAATVRLGMSIKV